jgi:hypothetical protein
MLYIKEQLTLLNEILEIRSQGEGVTYETHSIYPRNNGFRVI